MNEQNVYRSWLPGWSQNRKCIIDGQIFGHMIEIKGGNGFKNSADILIEIINLFVKPTL